ncbi:MAG: hypothetical protein JW797_15880 [Bradymonadales bacterium]|nr:hypothetical protein [Bradymonadales bacterium]
MSKTVRMIILAVLFAIGSASMALGQPVPEGMDPGPTDTLEDDEAEEQAQQITDLMRSQPVIYQVTFPRVQAIVTPSFILDGFFDMHPNHWGSGKVNLAFGAEFIMRHVDRFDLVFSVDWADIRTADDWWLESDEEIIDADWGENSLTMLTADVAINWITVLDPAWELFYGVGLGVGVFLGDFLKQDIDGTCFADPDVNPYQSQDTDVIRRFCEDADGNPQVDPNARKTEEDRIPPLIPALSLNFGSRWIFGQHWALQWELGFKNIYFYTGLEFGYIWW